MRKNKKSLFLILLVVIVFYAFLHYINFSRGLEQGSQKIFSPLERIFYNFGLTIKKYGHLSDILTENEYLKKELAKYSVDYIRLSQIEAENQYLKNELKYLEESGYDYKIAKVIGKQLYNEQILFINKGIKDGITEGLAATAYEGIIVGKVIAVEDYRSQVQLLTDANSRLAVTFGKTTGTNGVIRGKIGNSLLMEFIPQNIEVKEGEIAVTSGLENFVPQSLPVGKVGSVEKISGQIFQKANILPFFNYEYLQILTIIIPTH